MSDTQVEESVESVVETEVGEWDTCPCGRPVIPGKGEGAGGRGGLCGSCYVIWSRSRMGKWGRTQSLPARADLNTEIDWVVGSTLVPDTLVNPWEAPSKWAAAMLKQIRSDEALRRSFFDTIIKARITPGDVKAKRGSVVRDADVAGGVGGGESEAERMKRLLGDVT